MRAPIIFVTALLAAACPAHAAQTVLADLLARAPVEQTGDAMTAKELEACVTRARDLDKASTTLDEHIAVIDRLAAEDRFLKNHIEQEIPNVTSYDEKGINAFQQRVIKQSETTAKLTTERASFMQKQTTYQAALASFTKDCDGSFTRADLNAVKARLGIRP